MDLKVDLSAAEQAVLDVAVQRFVETIETLVPRLEVLTVDVELAVCDGDGQSLAGVVSGTTRDGLRVQ